jgi:His/Glu/Gln/Arg/opine family amino acid ABC transporter permease subunit
VFAPLHGYGNLLLQGFLMTIGVALASMVVATLLGLVGAWGKLARSRLARNATDAYTTIVRGVPELVMLLLVYYGVPTLIQDIARGLGTPLVLNLNPMIAGVLTLGFIYGAFSTEVFRSAYQAVPRGQLEAARAFGMSPWLVARRVLLPQMWRFALPGLGNVWIVLVKATALISVIELNELMRIAEVGAQATRLPFTFYFAAAMLYLALTTVSIGVQSRLEAWANRGVRRA